MRLHEAEVNPRVRVYSLSGWGDFSQLPPAKCLEESLLPWLGGLSLDGVSDFREDSLLKLWNRPALPAPLNFKPGSQEWGQSLDSYMERELRCSPWRSVLTDEEGYLLLHLSRSGVVDGLNVLTGRELKACVQEIKVYACAARFDKGAASLCSAEDTEKMRGFLSLKQGEGRSLGSWIPDAPLSPDTALPLTELYGALRAVVGLRLPAPAGSSHSKGLQALYLKVCECLDYAEGYAPGLFPNFLSQYLEVMLTTSGDLELEPCAVGMSPLCRARTDVRLLTPRLSQATLDETEDLRYAVYKGHAEGEDLVIDRLCLTTGKDFFRYFELIRGEVVQRVLKVNLPEDSFVTVPHEEKV